MEELIAEAFRVAISTEKSSYDLYRNASAMIPNGSGRRVFERLAWEEFKLIDEIVKYCPDALLSMTDETNEQREATGGNESVERRLFNHLRTALRDKHLCIQRYASYVETLREPAVCKVFELALSMSRRQYGLIAEEFRQADLRLHRPCVNRRAKRTHIRSINRRIPNEHSQLFISLQDCGRQSTF